MEALQRVYSGRTSRGMTRHVNFKYEVLFAICAMAGGKGRLYCSSFVLAKFSRNQLALISLFIFVPFSVPHLRICKLQHSDIDEISRAIVPATASRR